MRDKLIVVTCVHRRKETVEYCFDKLPLKKVVVYSDRQDNYLRNRKDIIALGQHANSPLSYKWQHALNLLKDIDFDKVVLLGSDDYVDQAFIDYVTSLDYDMIGFTDAYYESQEGNYYWAGYEGARHGEPVGAGKVYSKKFLERINYKLYPQSRESSLDHMAHLQCIENNASMHVTSLRENGLKLVDVKDGKGMNSIQKLRAGLKLVRC